MMYASRIKTVVWIRTRTHSVVWILYFQELWNKKKFYVG